MTKTDNFIKKSYLLHNDRYDYSLVEYIKSSEKVNIICPLHGKFQQTPNNHLRGQGCRKCVIDNQKSNTIDFIKKSIEIHGNNFIYDYVDYKNAKLDVIIICPTHGRFQQTPNNHLDGSGCPKCSLIDKNIKQRSNTINFIEKSNKIHNGKYKYDKVNYQDNNTKVIITCPIHGDFLQKPSGHKRGYGCKSCTITVSKEETIWLDSLNIPNINRNISILVNGYIFNVDAIDYESNTIYEFNGDYYHGNPEIYRGDVINKTINKTFGFLYEKTLKKEQILKDAGYNVKSIWEKDFKLINKIKYRYNV
jgi:hypothetical protein